MGQKQFEPVRLAITSGRLSTAWIYVLLGATGGALFEIAVCGPLDIVLSKAFNFFYGGPPIQLAEI